MAVATPKRPIFRNKAMKQYAQSMEKDILPRFATPPVFIFLWILLGLLIVAAIAAWFGQIPLFVAGSGVIQAQQDSNQAIVVVFLPASYLSKVQAGQPIQLQIGSSGQQISSTIDSVQPGIISPTEARQRYALGDAGPQVIPGPSVVVMAKLDPTISARTYAGSIVSAQAQIGSQHILSLLPGFSGLIGD